MTRPAGLPVWVHRLDDGDPPILGSPKHLGETPLDAAPFHTRSPRVVVRIEDEKRTFRIPIDLDRNSIEISIDLSTLGPERVPVGRTDGDGLLLAARREVTTDEYALFLASIVEPERLRRHLPSVGGWEKARVPQGWSGAPVCGIDYADAVAYCLWTGARLPKVSEWEQIAYGAPSSSRRAAEGDVTWARSNGPRPVGTRSADRTLAGLLDLAANVSEWVHPPREPGFDLAPGLLKGGSFLEPLLPLNRRFHPEDLPPQSAGFRVVESALPPGSDGSPPDPLAALESPDPGVRIAGLARLDPANGEAVDRVLEALGDPVLDVRRMAARTLERFPIDPGSLLGPLAEARQTSDRAADGLAFFLLARGEEDAAEALVDSFLSGPKGERLVYLLALLDRPASIDLGRPEVAGRLLDHLADLPAEDAHHLARSLVQMLAPTGAAGIAALRHALDPERDQRVQERIDAASTRWTRLVAAHLEEWPPRTSIEILSDAIELDPDNAAALFHRGFLRLGLREYEASIEDNSRAIEIDPEFTTAYNNRAAASFWSGRYEAVAGDAAIVIERAPGMPNPHFFRGAAAHRLGRPAVLLRDFRLAASKDPAYLLRRTEQLTGREPEEADARLLRAAALQATGHVCEAAEILEALDASGHEAPLLHYLRATGSILEGKFSATLDALRQAQRGLAEGTLERLIADDPTWTQPELAIPDDIQRFLDALPDRASRE